jgi:chromosome segregation ATPase
MSASADGFRDFLVEEGQRQQAAQRLADALPDPERVAADAEQAVEAAARDQIAGIAEQAESLDDGLVEMVTEARTLRKRITSGALTVEEAKEALKSLRQRHGATRYTLGVLRPRYEAAVEQVKNPAARRDELIAKYGL